MKRTTKARCTAAALIAVAASCTLAALDRSLWTDPMGDVLIRRTDPDGSAPILPAPVLPDVIAVALMPWAPLQPDCDPYAGLPGDPQNPHIVRIDVVFAGLVNPPGPLGVNGADFAPTCFGSSPVYGFIEFDVDNDRNTGGEFASAARTRTLAVAPRYGARPADPILSSRVPTSHLDADFDWQSPPYYERTGTDFAITLCGCHDAQIISEDGNMNGILDPGETMVVRGRFFQRAGGYRWASNIDGGSAPGSYDPLVDLRFKHEPTSNLTVVSLVYPLTMEGAAALAGEPVQQIDNLIDLAGSHHSVIEALTDIANGAHGSLSGLTAELTWRWAKKDPANYLNPMNWDVTFAVGTTYAQPAGAWYVWTDVGFNITRGDTDGDGIVSSLDRDAVQSAIAALDGSTLDLDGIINGEVVLGTPGAVFSLYDMNADGVLSAADVAWFTFPSRCYPDWNEDGVVDVPDIFAFLSDWFAGQGDFNGDGFTLVDDIFGFLAAWFQGCA